MHPQVPNPCPCCGAAIDGRKYVGLVDRGRSCLRLAEQQLAEGKRTKALANMNETLKAWNGVLHRLVVVRKRAMALLTCGYNCNFCPNYTSLKLTPMLMFSCLCRPNFLVLKSSPFIM